MKRAHFLHLLAALGLAGLAAGSAQAQSSDTPLKIVVPFAVGGPTDQIARIISEPLAKQLGRPVILDNRGGAGGVVGTAEAARATPDGLTIMLTTSAFVITSGTTPNLSYNARKDFEPLYLLGDVQTAIAVRPELGVNTLAELVALGKKRQLNFGTTGVGGTMHIGAVLFSHAASEPMTHVPYRGAGPALIDLMGGQVDFVNADVPVLAPYVKAGKLKALVVFDTHRSPLFPDVPTAAEAGMPSLQMNNWYAIFAPAGVPPAVRAKLEAAIAAVVNQPDIAKRLTDAGLINPRSSGSFKKTLSADFDRWIPWLKEANIRTE